MNPALPSFDPNAFEKRTGELLDTLFTRGSHTTPPHLADAIRYSLLGPGKRFRPRLAHATATALGLNPKISECAEIAIEMIHCFTLIHDDLPCMDDDDLRRGKPSTHKAFGEATALLAGDALIGLAFEALLRSRAHGTPPERVLAATARLAHAIGPRGVCGGQAAEATLNEKSTLADLEKMHAAKTGALFVAPIILIRELAGIPEGSPLGVALEQFALDFGAAFQLWDDLEDGLQDTEQDGTATHTSVFRYLSFEDAKKRAEERLERAKMTLIQVMEDQARPLLQIADELSAKIAQIGSA